MNNLIYSCLKLSCLIHLEVWRSRKLQKIRRWGENLFLFLILSCLLTICNSWLLWTWLSTPGLQQFEHLLLNIYWWVKRWDKTHTSSHTPFPFSWLTVVKVMALPTILNAIVWQAQTRNTENAQHTEMCFGANLIQIATCEWKQSSENVFGVFITKWLWDMPQKCQGLSISVAQ